MTEAMGRHEAGAAKVIPIILRPCLWQTAPFSKLQALPADGGPVTTWPNRDEACANVAEEIIRRQLRGEPVTVAVDANVSENESRFLEVRVHRAFLAGQP